MLSIIIPTYNRKNYLNILLESINKQNFKDFEIIIIDDNSIDGTEEFININWKKDNINYLKNNENLGPGYNRKLGFNKSIGEYIIFADDDDYYIDTSFFAKAINILKNNHKLSFCSGNVKNKYEYNNTFSLNRMNITGEINHSEYFNNFMIEYDKPSSTFSTIFRRSSLLEGGICKMNMVNDASIYLRALLAGNAFIINDIVGIYRIHDSNITLSLKPDFIKDNILEKVSAGKIAYETGILSDYDKWIFKQIRLTIRYYNINKISINEYIKLYHWCSSITYLKKDIFYLFCEKLIKYYINKIKKWIKK